MRRRKISRTTAAPFENWNYRIGNLFPSLLMQVVLFRSLTNVQNIFSFFLFVYIKWKWSHLNVTSAGEVKVLLLSSDCLVFFLSCEDTNTLKHNYITFWNENNYYLWAEGQKSICFGWLVGCHGMRWQTHYRLSDERALIRWFLVKDAC